VLAILISSFTVLFHLFLYLPIRSASSFFLFVLGRKGTKSRFYTRVRRPRLSCLFSISKNTRFSSWMLRFPPHPFFGVPLLSCAASREQGLQKVAIERLGSIIARYSKLVTAVRLSALWRMPLIYPQFILSRAVAYRRMAVAASAWGMFEMRAELWRLKEAPHFVFGCVVPLHASTLHMFPPGCPGRV
jgi:hypothetical protein